MKKMHADIYHNVNMWPTPMSKSISKYDYICLVFNFDVEVKGLKLLPKYLKKGQKLWCFVSVIQI